MSDEQDVSEIGIELTYSDGSTATMSEGDFIDQLDQSFDIVEATVSIEEGRQRQQYEMAKKFCSMKIDFRAALAWVNACSPGSKMAAKKAMRKAAHRALMRTEQLLVNNVLHMLYKDNLPAYPRDPHNVFCQEPYDLRTALELQHKTKPKIGASSRRTIR